MRVSWPGVTDRTRELHGLELEPEVRDWLGQEDRAAHGIPQDPSA
jgi:hypothetical protein